MHRGTKHVTSSCPPNADLECCRNIVKRWGKRHQQHIYRIVSSAICNKMRLLLSLLSGTVLIASITAKDTRAKM